MEIARAHSGKGVTHDYHDKRVENEQEIANDGRWAFLDEPEFKTEMTDSLRRNPQFDDIEPSILCLMHQVLYNIMDSFRDSHFGCKDIHDENRKRIKNGYSKLGQRLQNDAFLHFIAVGAAVVGLVGSGYAMPIKGSKVADPGKILASIAGVGTKAGDFANAFQRGGQEMLRGDLQAFQNDLKSDETTDGKIVADLQRLQKLTSDADERQFQAMRKTFGNG